MPETKNTSDDTIARLTHERDEALRERDAEADGLTGMRVRAKAAEAEVERLRAGLRGMVSDLREHVPDGCAGPRGSAREGACPDCRRAEYIERHLLASAETEEER